jgi:DNA-binding CsgD family transcriptional regulator/catechol 2,3-dioxygenase-like lactoylglutathione lyase family enzyme
LDALTPAEWRVTDSVRHGLTNKDIAARHGFSVNAVKYHLANILAKLGLQNRAQLRAFRGVERASALSKQERQDEMQLGSIGQISRSVADIAASMRWYGEVLGFRHLYTFGELAFFDCGGTRLFLSKGGVKAESILYFRVPDIQTAYEELSSRGVAFLGAPHRIHRHEDGTEEWMAFFNDLEGRPLALMSAVKP